MNRTIAGIALAVALAVGIVVGGVISALGNHTPKSTSTSCQQAANAQDAYAQLADQQGYLTTFTNEQMLASNEIDGALVENMVKAGCPETIRYFDMLTGQWVNG
jgi:hypothetical protein